MTRYALDIGSTVVKLAHLDAAGALERQDFFPRDFVAGIAAQVRTLLADHGIDPARDSVRVCSSANGGLRVGIVCLAKHFSGAALRNQILLAGANPVFVHDFDEAAAGDSSRVDILLVGGGIDGAPAGRAAAGLAAFDAARYRHGALVYAGNRELAAGFARRFPGATVIDNPLGETLSSRVGSVFETVRRAYLDDLVFKEGVSELPRALSANIRPTPEVASRGFLRAVLNPSSFGIVGACIALDIGGATTDLHYSVEVVADDSAVRPAGGVSVARYVFTDIGIVASRDTLVAQLRGHPQLYEFLTAVLTPAAPGSRGHDAADPAVHGADARGPDVRSPDARGPDPRGPDPRGPDVRGPDVREVFAALREGEHAASAELLGYACLFIALDRFAKGRGPGLPSGDLDRVAQIILTGGAAAGAGRPALRDLGRWHQLGRRLADLTDDATTTKKARPP